MYPEYLKVTTADLGKGTPVKVRILGDMASIGLDLAEVLKAEIVAANRDGRGATLIIRMDEYLTDDDAWVPETHRLSFRAYLNRKFYDLLDPALAPPPEHRVFPDPRNLEAVPRLIAARGGVDACCGGIGITGHIAFNEPPEPGEPMSLDAFAALPTRILSLTRETRTINSVTVGGEMAVIPRRAVTVGMKEILGARRLRLYCNRPWQSAVARRVLHGPITPACPASLMRTHPDATLTVADYVAAPPDIRLR
jgi:glucosamine-6-phosphate deaminase